MTAVLPPLGGMMDGWGLVAGDGQQAINVALLWLGSGCVPSTQLTHGPS